MVKNLYFSNRREYYRRKRISASLKKYYAEKKRERIIKAQEDKKIFRSLIQVRFKGKDATSEYEYMKVRIWIDDNKTHSEEELRLKLRELPNYKKLFGIGIGKKNVAYDVAYEVEEISKNEVERGLELINYFINIKGYEYDGII